MEGEEGGCGGCWARGRAEDGARRRARGGGTDGGGGGRSRRKGVRGLALKLRRDDEKVKDGSRLAGEV